MRHEVIAVALCAGLWSGVASAQSAEKDADAERLFREGQKLLQEKRYGEACPKFEAAYAKDHQLGTLLNLAYCHKEQGAPWRAWVEFKEAEVLAIEHKRLDRRDFARQRMAELEKGLGHLAIDLTSKVELTDVLVGDEDRRVPEAEKGLPFAAEPGQRKVTFRAKGKKDTTLMVPVVKGDRVVHIAVPAMAEADPVPVAVAPVAEQPKPPPPPPEETGRGRKVLTFGLLGVGIVGVGLGAVTGWMTLQNDCASHGRSTDACPGGTDPLLRKKSQDKVDQAQTTGLVSTLAFIGGGAALAGALILYVTAPSNKPKEAPETEARRRITPELGAGWAGVSGTF